MPYWRLSGFYFFYFASLGALLPYWSLYLKSLGFDNAAIGNLMAIIMATKIISPNIWGWIADHTGRRMTIVRIGSLVAALIFAGVFFGHGFWWLAGVMLGFSFFWNAALPQFEATTFGHLRDDVHRYNTIRLWGSVGFIIAGWGLADFMADSGIQNLPWVLLLLFSAIWINSLLVPEETAGHLPLDHEPLRKVLAQPRVIGLLLVCFLMQASHGPYYTFYSIHLTDHGYSLPWVGGLWALGVIAEVGLFLIMYKLVQRFGLRRLLLASLLLAALRWLMIGSLVESREAMLLAQLLHAATFGIYHAAAIQLVHRYFRGRHQGKGQALYSSLSFGAGGALGSVYSGYVYESFGAVPMFTVAAGLALLGFVLAWRYVPADAPVRVRA